MQLKPRVLIVPGVILTFALLGGLAGPGGGGSTAAAADRSEQDIDRSVRTFTKVFSIVEENAADPVDPSRAIYNGAIPGMLHTLDPHSNFYDPKLFQLLREDQRGQYYGVGMLVRMHRGRVVVVNPFPGSPAYNAGIRPSDIIHIIDGEVTEGWDQGKVAERLKGARGTTVKVTMIRRGAEGQKELNFDIIRDEIPRKSVADAFYVRPGIAYLQIKQFNENTSSEMEQNLRRLKEDQIKGLVLDLRGNPGGILNEGVNVADHFLKKGQAIVSHRGRASAQRKYEARRGSRGADYPIVVLVDSSSASAAEIVAGALQDHDRAWILGEQTFGKGLVQTVFPLSEDTGLALTTAKYYTPSGRLIQRDYSKVSFYDYYSRKNSDAKDLEDVRMTDSGRTVYGGGGITPDEKVEGPKPNGVQFRLREQHMAYSMFAAYYFARNSTSLGEDFTVTEGMLSDFQDFLKQEKIELSAEELEANRKQVVADLKRAMFTYALGDEKSEALMIREDAMVERAVEAMGRAQSLQETARKTIAQRDGGSQPEDKQ
ncbi:MAG: S41 family peptidase [Bryobacterales bacterium]|jgi:carboxyl-terminal processing protease|nr:S41 family peptidase [Bryobacterales bacterium]